MRVISLNVNGIRSACRKGLLPWLARQKADFICLQETKAQLADLNLADFKLNGYQLFYVDAEKKGYSGVAIYSRHQPGDVISKLGWRYADREGRYLELVFDDLRVVSLYLPSGSSNEIRQQVKFDFMQRYLQHLKRCQRLQAPYLICGDWNIAHRAIDLTNDRANAKNSGFLPEERAWLDQVFSLGYVDVLRTLDQREHQYTWWSNRGNAWSNNVGWRIDYQIASPAIAQDAESVNIYKRKRFSDHAPLIIDYARKLT